MKKYEPPRSKRGGGYRDLSGSTTKKQTFLGVSSLSFQSLLHRKEKRYGHNIHKHINNTLKPTYIL